MQAIRRSPSDQLGSSPNQRGGHLRIVDGDLTQLLIQVALVISSFVVIARVLDDNFHDSADP